MFVICRYSCHSIEHSPAATIVFSLLNIPPPLFFLSKFTACDCYGYLSSPAHHVILLLILMMIVCGIWNTSACATVSFNSIPGSAQKWSPLMFVLVHTPTHPDSVSATKKCELDDQPRRYLCSMNECWWNSHLGPTNLHIPFHVSSFTAFRSSPALLFYTPQPLTNRPTRLPHIHTFEAFVPVPFVTTNNVSHQPPTRCL